MRLAVGHHGEESPARVIILSISLEVLAKLLNALRQYGNLHFRGASVRVMDRYFLDELCFLGLRNHTSTIAHFDTLCKLARWLSVNLNWKASKEVP